MNMERMKELRDAIANGIPDVRFDMNTWYDPKDPCGTVACIGGHCEILWPSVVTRGPRADYRGNSSSSLSEMLGLVGRQSVALFYPPDHMDWAAITKEQALEVIDKLIAKPDATYPEIYDWWYLAVSGEPAPSYYEDE